MLANQLAIVHLFSARSEWLLRDRIASKLEAVEKASRAELFVAGRDFRAHLTVNTAKYKGTAHEAEHDFMAVALNPKLYQMGLANVGHPRIVGMIYDNKGNGLLTNDAVSPRMAKFRTALWEMEAAGELGPFEMNDIADWEHSTAFRVLKPPPPEAREDFVGQVDRIMAEFGQTQLDIGATYVGQTLSFLNNF